jgi:hypothetical protein
MADFVHLRPRNYQDDEPIFHTVGQASSAERILRLRLLLTQARDRLEGHRDPMVAEIDRGLRE